MIVVSLEVAWVRPSNAIVVDHNTNGGVTKVYTPARAAQCPPPPLCALVENS